MYGQFFVIFAMIFTGFLLRKIGFIKEEMNNSLNKFIVYCAYPCLLAYNIGIMDMTVDFLLDFILMLCVSEVILLGFALYARIYGKLRHFPVRVSNVIELSMTCPNNGFMGFPMGLAMLGSTGLFLMTAQNSAMNIFFFTYALYALRRNNTNKNKLTVKAAAASVMKVILNPNIVALFVGLAIFEWRSRGRKQDGDTCLIFLLFYGASQVVLDSTRYDSLFFRSNGFVSMVQVLAAVAMAFAAVLFSVRLVKRTGLRWWYVLLWLLQAAGVGAAGYMEYYVQRRGNEAVFAYSVMSACLLAVVALALVIRSLGRRSRKSAADFIG